KLLRGWAKKRREETPADFDLHPVNRRLLQGEIAEHFGRQQAPRRSVLDRLTQIWPRIAIGAGAFAALVVLALVFWSSPQKERSQAMPGELRSATPLRSEPQMSSLPAARPGQAAPAKSPTPQVALAYADQARTVTAKDALAPASNSLAQLQRDVERAS